MLRGSLWTLGISQEGIPQSTIYTFPVCLIKLSRLDGRKGCTGRRRRRRKRPTSSPELHKKSSSSSSSSLCPQFFFQGDLPENIPLAVDHNVVAGSKLLFFHSYILLLGSTYAVLERWRRSVRWPEIRGDDATLFYSSNYWERYPSAPNKIRL